MHHIPFTHCPFYLFRLRKVGETADIQGRKMWVLDAFQCHFYKLCQPSPTYSRNSNEQCSLLWQKLPCSFPRHSDSVSFAMKITASGSLPRNSSATTAEEENEGEGAVFFFFFFVLTLPQGLNTPEGEMFHGNSENIWEIFAYQRRYAMQPAQARATSQSFFCIITHGAVWRQEKIALGKLEIHVFTHIAFVREFQHRILCPL